MRKMETESSVLIRPLIANSSLKGVTAADLRRMFLQLAAATGLASNARYHRVTVSPWPVQCG